MLASLSMLLLTVDPRDSRLSSCMDTKKMPLPLSSAEGT